MSRKVDSRYVRPSKMAHFVLRTRRMDELIAWYQAVLGMEVVHRNPQIAFLSYDEEHHRMAIAQTPVEAEVPKGAPGLDHVAYTLDSLDELLATYKRLKEAGILPAWPINHGLTTSLYYEDPEGNRVEFQVEHWSDPEKLKGFMEGEAFAANPIGVGFDPEKLLERYERGDPEEELFQQGSA